MGWGALGVQRPLGLALYRIVLGGHSGCKSRTVRCRTYTDFSDGTISRLGRIVSQQSRLPKRQADTPASESDIPGDGGGDEDDDGGDDDPGPH